MQKTSANPISKINRIDELDAFRGFAILGIFMVNILVMNVTFVYRAEWEAEQTGMLQSISFFILETVFYSKFFTIFSFLFGLGVALQMQRMREKGVYSTAFFIRRFSALIVFGVLHILFIWSGDILHLYGALGFVLLFAFKCNPRVLLWSAVVIFFFPYYPEMFDQLMEWLSIDYGAPLSAYSRADVMDLKHNGDYLSGVSLRMKEYSFAAGLMYAHIAPVAISMMFLGGYLVKKGVLNDLKGFAKKITVPLLAIFVVIMTYRFILLYVIIPGDMVDIESFLAMVLTLLFIFSDVMTALFFLWAITLLYQSSFFKKIIAPLRYVGRMAFTNYIMQSVIGYLVMRTFNGYEAFSAFGCCVLVLSVFIVQIVLSKIWLSYFKFGPLEWCWRCISYWKILPIRK